MSDKESKKKKEDVAEENEKSTESTETSEIKTDDNVENLEATKNDATSSSDETCEEPEKTPIRFLFFTLHSFPINICVKQQTLIIIGNECNVKNKKRMIMQILTC